MLGNALYPLGTNLARYRIWDGIRGLDYLASLPEVDAQRLGCVGNSGGGTLTAYIAALDDRVKAAAIGCYITTLPRRMGNRIQADPDADPEQDIAGFVSAGIDGQDRPALELDPAYFRRVLEVNLLGAFIVARAAGRAMDGGAIVLNASVNGLRAEARFADYNASKGGVVMLARTLARDLGAQGFWVTAVCPGYVRTRMTAPYLDDPATSAELLAEIPSGRIGEPDEVAALVSFLASPEASYMNGSVVTIDGGRLA